MEKPGKRTYVRCLDITVRWRNRQAGVASPGIIRPRSGYYNEMVSLIRNLLGNALKTNDSLYFAVLTGCLRISKESIFTGLNNPKVHTISDLRYDEYFGFTDADVDKLLEFYGLSSYKDTIRDWYDGYRFGDTDVYCPWDVINYCDELLAAPGTPPKNYWANTSGNDLVLRLLKKADQTTKDEVEELLNGGKITKGNYSGNVRGLPVGFHQCAGYGSTQEHERKFLSWDVTGIT